MLDRILLVDDDLGVIKAMSRMLAGVGKVQFACSCEEALRLIRETPPSLILLDAEMPGMSGFQACELLKADPALCHIPVIFVTSHSDTATEVAGLALGAVDFIAKPVSPPLLLARVQTQLRIKQLSDELRRTATTDSLTQIANRRSFDDSLRREWTRARRGAEPMSVLMIDVDHFKLFNDHYGHAAGDRCLHAVAQALADASLRPADIVARYGGEEFVMLLPQTPRTGAAHVATRIVAAVEVLDVAHAVSPTAGHVTVSVGMSCYDSASAGWRAAPDESRFHDEIPHAIQPAQLLRAADVALYAAKSAGRAQAWMLDASAVDSPGLARPLTPLGRVGRLTAVA